MEQSESKKKTSLPILESLQQPISEPSVPQPQQPNPTPVETKVPLKKKVTIEKKGDKDVVVVRTKMDLFLEEYVNNNGNATEAAMKVFDVKDRISAANVGQAYLKRAAAAKRVLLEQKGYTEGRMLDVAIAKMQVSKTPEWWDRLMKIAGYEDFLAKGPVTKQTVNIMQVQKDLLDDYVDGEYVEDQEE